MGRNTLRMDFSGFNELITKFDELNNGGIEEIVTKALQMAADRVTEDTFDALKKENLPAKGDYSFGDTVESVVAHPKVVSDGAVISVSVGFDYSKPGAGGYLIKGSPRHRKAAKLNMVYTGKGYMKNHVKKPMEDMIQAEIAKKMEGK